MVNLLSTADDFLLLFLSHLHDGERKHPYSVLGGSFLSHLHDGEHEPFQASLFRYFLSHLHDGEQLTQK